MTYKMTIPLIEINQEPRKEIDKIETLEGDNYYCVYFTSHSSIEFQNIEEFEEIIKEDIWNGGCEFIEEGYLFTENDEDIHFSKNLICEMNHIISKIESIELDIMEEVKAERLDLMSMPPAGV